MRAKEDGFSGEMGAVWRILSLAGGIGLLFWAFLRPGRRNVRRIAGGAYMLASGIAGRDLAMSVIGAVRGRRARRPIAVEEAVTVARPREDIYAFWRNFENLPQVMRHVEEVRLLERDRSHWRARAPLGMDIEWESELTVDRPNERISWRSLPGSQIYTEGTVRFEEAPAGFGTEVRVHMVYQLPLGRLGAAVAKLFGEEPGQEMHDDLRRLKQLLETGEIPSVHGQTSARIGEVRREREEGEVESEARAGIPAEPAARRRVSRRDGGRRGEAPERENRG